MGLADVHVLLTLNSSHCHVHIQHSGCCHCDQSSKVVNKTVFSQCIHASVIVTREGVKGLYYSAFFHFLGDVWHLGCDSYSDQWECNQYDVRILVYPNLKCVDNQTDINCSVCSHKW